MFRPGLLVFPFLFAVALPAAYPQAVPVAPDSLRLLHRALREAIRMQLPPTLPDDRYGTPFAKNYSLDYVRAEALAGYQLEIPEKRLDPVSGELRGGGRYLVPVRAVDLDRVRVVADSGSQRFALALPAREGASFVYHPYDQRPDEATGQVLLGWYEPVQERTLHRVAELLRTFLSALAAPTDD